MAGCFSCCVFLFFGFGQFTLKNKDILKVMHWIEKKVLLVSAINF